MLLELLLPGVPGVLYGAAGATVHLVLDWKPMDSALWPLTGRQRGFKHARRPDYRVIESLEEEFGFTADLAQAIAEVEGAQSGPPDDGFADDFTTALESHRLVVLPPQRKVSGPHPGPTCLCAPCTHHFEEAFWDEPTVRPGAAARLIGLMGDRWIDQRLSELHASLDTLYRRPRTSETNRAIRAVRKEYDRLLERKDAL